MWQVCERLEIGPVQLLAPPVIDYQPTRDRPQEGTWRVQLQMFATLQQAHEGILRQVRGIGGIAQLAAQPGMQPVVVVAVERLQGIVAGHG